MKKILMIVAMIGVGILAPILVPIATEGVYAANANTDICTDAAISKELKEVAGCGDFGNTKKTAVPIALNIINVALTLVGLMAVMVIIYGGILYVISTGDSARTTKAKNCILYGVIGLVVALLAYAVVAFVNLSVLKK